MKDWTYNEFNQVGVDYSKTSKVSEYDEEMESFRDYAGEVKAFVEKLNISNTKELVVADIGCGTGAFSIHAAKYFKKIYAVDVSKEMLKRASTKADDKNIDSIEFVSSGFLQFDPKEKVDVIFTKWAFHHLPDYWKQAALLNMNRALKQGGVLFISDVVFKFDPNYKVNTESLITSISNDLGQDVADETKTHIRDEYSTFDWIIQGLVERAGFVIENSETNNPLISEYFCRKIINL